MYCQSVCTLTEEFILTVKTLKLIKIGIWGKMISSTFLNSHTHTQREREKEREIKYIHFMCVLYQITMEYKYRTFFFFSKIRYEKYQSFSIGTFWYYIKNRKCTQIVAINCTVLQPIVKIRLKQLQNSVKGYCQTQSDNSLLEI